MIAFNAACDDIVPGFSAAFHYRHDVVKCEVLGSAFLAAILADVVVPRIDICTAKLDVLKAFPDLHIFQQAEDAGQLDGKADAPHLAIIFGQYFNLALAQQTERALPADNVDRLVGGV